MKPWELLKELYGKSTPTMLVGLKRKEDEKEDFKEVMKSAEILEKERLIEKWNHSEGPFNMTYAQITDRGVKTKERGYEWYRDNRGKDPEGKSIKERIKDPYFWVPALIAFLAIIAGIIW